AAPVRHYDGRTEKLLANMADTLYNYRGVGLAAPQIGVSKRLVVVDIGKGLLELVNPEILWATGVERGKEGCLSLPGLWGEVDRATEIEVRYLDRRGRELRFRATGFLARVLQHEIDHLDGILFIDRAVSVQRE
ncbi:MAG: peptide deformylase, partial [Bacillota bacterium]